MSSYQPHPIDTAATNLGPELDGLVEQLAENAHEVWASKRLADGWQFGTTRDDAAKTHPCLVPYAQLPEREKAYDRAMVEQAFKAALALGWCIDRPRHTQ